MTFTKEEKKCIVDVWGQINPDQVGADALARLLCVNPWTRRYFKIFGDLSNCDAVLHNANVAAHGAKVMKSIGDALGHIDDLRGYYADLSRVHYQKFHVDPANFKLFAGIVSCVVAIALSQGYTPQKQAAFEKFLHGVSRALGSGYC